MFVYIHIPHRFCILRFINYISNYHRFIVYNVNYKSMVIIDHRNSRVKIIKFNIFILHVSPPILYFSY